MKMLLDAERCPDCESIEVLAVHGRIDQHDRECIDCGTVWKQYA
jgi:Zn ribbon nucleic-acid-binding protein